MIQGQLFFIISEILGVRAVNPPLLVHLHLRAKTSVVGFFKDCYLLILIYETSIVEWYRMILITTKHNSNIPTKSGKNNILRTIRFKFMGKSQIVKWKMKTTIQGPNANLRQ